MIARLILQHEVIRSLGKPLLINLVTVSLVINLLTYQMARENSTVLVEGFREVLIQFAFLVPVALILTLGKARRRCRPWEMGLPLPAPTLWWVHLLALALAALVLILVTAGVLLSFGALLGLLGEKTLLKPGGMVLLVARPTVASLAAAGLVALRRPGLGDLEEDPGWPRFRMLVLACAAVLLGCLIVLPGPMGILPVIVMLAVVWQVASGLAPAMSSALVDDEPCGMVAGTTQAAVWGRVGPSRWVVHLTVLRMLFKWPLGWLALWPMVIIFGLIMSGYSVLGMEQPYLRFLNFFLAAYILIASVNYFMEKLHKLDHLPIDRRFLLRWLVVPVSAMFLLGYAGGRILDSVSTDRSERILFENAEDGYGLKVPPEYFSFTLSSGSRLVSAPWGETHEMTVTPVMKGLPGGLWKTYGTPEGASLEFVAWQISRAAAAVYGLTIDPGEISARYLEADLHRRVTVREAGLTLVADYPEARLQGLGPVMPFLAGGDFVLSLGILGFFFGVFKPGVTIRKARTVFWLLMGGLLALHISGFFLLIFRWTREWLVYGFWLGRMRELGELGFAGHGAGWLVMALVVALAWRWAERSFLAVEAPSR